MPSIDYNKIKKIAENYHAQVSAFIKDKIEWWHKAPSLISDGYFYNLESSLDIASKIIAFRIPSPNLSSIDRIISGFYNLLKDILDTSEKIHSSDLDKSISTQEIFVLEKFVTETYNHLTPLIKSSETKSNSTVNKKRFTVLKLNSKGENVKKLQTALKQLNLYRSTIDGTFGKATEVAVRGFQTDYELPITSEVDEETFDKLLSIVASRTKVPGSIENVKLEIIDDLLKAAKRYNNAIVDLSQELSVWYNKIESEAEKEFGLSIAASSDGASVIQRNEDNYRNDVAGENNAPLVLLQTQSFYQSLNKVINSSNKLLQFYQVQKNSSDPENEINTTRFKKIAEEYLSYVSIILHGIEYPATPYKPVFPTIVVEDTFQKFSQTDFSTDSVEGKLTDRLNITDDVNALASVITYKKVQPPLAIGLFGNWGSGKSFFMKLLKERMETLTLDDTGTYCKEVVHVWFNSWHYSDANLWASLITKIFEELKTQGIKKNKSLNDLYQNLNSAQELKKETTDRQNALQKEIEVLQIKAEGISTEIKQKAGKLAEIKTSDIVQAVFNNKDVNKDVQEIKKKLPHPIVENVQQINENIITIGSAVKRFFECIKLVWSFRRGKTLLVLLTAIIVFAVPFLLKYLQGNHADIFSRATIITATILSITSNIVIFILPLKNKMDTVYKRLLSLKQTCETIENEEITVKKELVIKIQSDIADREKKIQELENDLTDLASGKKLSSFIESRVTDQRYVNSLGIISWIRKDFEQLGGLLRVQSQLKTNEINKPAEEPIKDGMNEIKTKADVLEVERIMLYIDDLDRCNKETVVRVLEAIHLLLAFDLFVVVVGVDPRWMYSALQQSYTVFLQPANAEQQKTENNLFHLTKQATPFDYLEKIFQIPFLLKPINAKGREDLIASQFAMENKTDKQNNQPEKTEQQKDGNKLNNLIDENKNEISDEKSEDIEIGADQPDLTAIKKDEVKQQETKKAIELLTILPEEINFMKAVSQLIGDSPRTIKRFTNIYRIIRTHTKLQIKGEPLETYCTIILLLGIVTGLPDDSNKVFSVIRNSNKKTFEDILSDYANLPVDLKKALQAKYKLSDGTEVEAGKLLAEKLKLNLELVLRFSFRGYELAEEITQ
jgi:peptidoglycan hydrolase-like protein with peptidoglycan-binding domain